MIAYIKGQLVSAHNGVAVLDTGGLGYAVMVPDSFCQQAQPGKVYTLHTKLMVRENDMYLVGFVSLQELEMFNVLVSVSGIGAKMAVKVLSYISPACLAHSIACDDPALFTQVPGIGRKTAEKLLFELKRKIGERCREADSDITTESGLSAGNVMHGDAAKAVSVLVSLGCTQDEAQKALQEALLDTPELDGVDNMVMAAMTVMGADK